jgi:predicted transcriptional regulator
MKVVFKPAKRGIEKILGALERAILEVLWEKPDLTGRDVYERVRSRKKTAYTTVLTVLNRMVEKGSLRREREDGLYVYNAAMTREEFERRVASAVIKGIYDIAPSQTVSTFVDILSRLEEHEVENILKAIEKQKKEASR